MATIQLLLTDDANRQALGSLVGQRHSTVTDTDLRDADLYLVDDASFPQYRDPIIAHKREQAPVFCPVVLIRRGQSPISIDLSAVESSEGPPLIDEIVAAPVERQVLFRRIENLVSRRRQTVDLHEKNQRLEQLASMLRHEIRNPLSILDGYLDVARTRGDPESFDRCQAAIDRMQRMFDDTLLIVQGYEIELNPRPVDLAVVSRECWDVISESDAEIEITTSRQVLADEIRLRQLLANLYRNAVEHGGDDITVTVGDLEDGFYLEDDGVGIPPKERETVFGQGYSTSVTGSGLGLEVVKNVVDAHEWAVRVTDGTDGGARFEITGVEDA